MKVNRWKKLVLLPFILIVVMLACNMPDSTTPTKPALIQEQESGPGEESGDQVSPEQETEQPDSPKATQDPALVPTMTLTPTITLTPTATFTPTPDVPLVSVSVNTNCRSGPGKPYDILGALLVGEEAEIVGVSSQGHFYIIRNPDDPGGFCWLWDQYAEVQGDPNSLPRMTPPPSPTPEATFSYQVKADNIHGCGADGVMMYWVANDGGLDLESARVKVVNVTTSTTLFGPGSTNNPFVASSSGCPPGVDSLGRGGVAYLAIRLNATPSGGDVLRATIKICAQDGLGEPCKTKTVDYTVASLPSDVNLKENITPVAQKEILEKVVQLPISVWNYTFQDENVRHIGPMAQDFSQLFAVGDSETHIYPLDAGGVALASIQALHQEMESLETRMAQLEARQASPAVPDERDSLNVSWWVPLLALGAGIGVGVVAHKWWLTKKHKIVNH